MPIKALSHLQQIPRASRPSASDRGYDRAWQKLRLAQLREQPACEMPGCERPATIVDHRKPISQGGEQLERENLRSVCRSCHDRLTDNLRKTGVNELPAYGCRILGDELPARAAGNS